MPDDNRSQPYPGLDQRREARRKGSERRKEIRFELDKEDRRNNPGRRGEDKSRNIWKQHDV